MLHLRAVLVVLRTAIVFAACGCARPPTFGRPELVASLVPRNIYDVMEGVTSPDGKSIAYEQRERSEATLWILDVATRQRRQLSPRIGRRNGLAWSYDGRQLAFSGDVAGAGSSEVLRGIWVIDIADGTERLAYPVERFGGYAHTPTWTRDGRIVFARVVDSFAAMSDEVMVVDPRTGAAARVSVERIRGAALSVAPDGIRVAYIGPDCPDTSSWGVRTMSMATFGVQSRCLAGHVRSQQDLVWTPDGRTIFAVEGDYRDSLPRVVAIDAMSGRKYDVDVRGTMGRVRKLSISDDGWLTLISQSGSLHVGTVPASGGVPTVLQRDAALTTALPVWSHDGSTVAAYSALPQFWGVTEQSFVTQLAAGDDPVSRGIAKPRDDRLTRLAVSPDGLCSADEGSAASRDSLMQMSGVTLPASSFGQAPFSYGHSGVPNVMTGYFAGTQWSADGSFVVKQSYGRLYVIRRESLASGGCRAHASVQRVELGGFHGAPIGWRLSPDGRSIAFSRLPRVDDVPGVFIVPTSGGPVRTVRLLPRDGTFGGPEWSPDGQALYYADADSAGTYRILRHTLATGAIDTITRGPRGAAHPRLSPDGRTLAVTVIDATTTIWRMARLGTQVASVARRDTAAPVVGPRPPAAAAPDPRLLDLVARIAAHADGFDRKWPGYWPATRPYGLIAPSVPGVLVVAERTPIVGFEEVQAPGAPAGMRVFWHPSLMENYGGVGVPIVVVAPVPAANAATDSVVRWREAMLHAFFASHGVLGQALPRVGPGAEHAVSPSCMDGLESSCAIGRQLERRILSAALAAPASDRAAMARLYVAVRWSRWTTGGDEQWPVERLAGMGAYAAGRTAALAAGGDTARYGADVEAALAGLALTATGDWDVRQRHAAVTGQALAVLLDRLGYDWRPMLRGGRGFVDALADAVRFDSTTVLRTLAEAYRTFAGSGLPTSTGVPADTGKGPLADPAWRSYVQAGHFWNLLHAIERDSLPLVVAIPTGADGVIDTTVVRMRFVAGRGDSVVTTGGLVVLPDPETFVVESPEFRIEVHHVPVIVQRRPGNWPTSTRITIFLPDSVIARIRPQGPRRDLSVPPALAETDSDQWIRGPGYDVWFRRGTSVGISNLAPTAMYVTAARPPGMR